MKRWLILFGASVLFSTVVVFATTDVKALTQPCPTGSSSGENMGLLACPGIKRAGFPFATDPHTRMWQSTVALNFLIIFFAAYGVGAISWRLASNQWGRIYLDEG